MACVDMALILGSTWLAIHGLLKRNAIDLLSGESTANVKERFYEHTRLWSRMSLFSQTVVNNCVNDTRRVVAALVGVVGCTALIVTAVTLLGNVALSLIRHYEEVYEFNSVACFDDEGDGQAKAAAMVLYDEGVYSSPAFMRQLQARKEGGSRSLVRLVVPTNERVFKNVYHVISSSGGEADLEKDGVWVSAAYGEHMGVGAGDQVTLTENTGKTHDFTVAGVFDYYLLRQEFVMSKETSARQAKAYIYRDSIVLTIIGVLLGILLGAIVGGYTVFALEPDEGFFIKSFYPPAALVGCVGAVVFAGAALLWSLRRIPRFDLTDINRF
ncbi:MAG: ABC transporter permease [Atopobiaceae bacterium]|nr:ABC transporter permease [Atopobiaceae bacterium]